MQAQAFPPKKAHNFCFFFLRHKSRWTAQGFSWVRFSQSIRSGSQRFFEKLGESVKKEIGFDLDSAKVELSGWMQDSIQKSRDGLERVNSELVPQFINWNMGTLEVENQDTAGTWHDRLQAWKEILHAEKLSEQLDSLNAKYAVEFDMKEVENSLRKDVVEKKHEEQGHYGSQKDGGATVLNFPILIFFRNLILQRLLLLSLQRI
ncbi:ATP-dependent zinc metalloprotease FTSH 12, chloroplastic [Olea europaea subsp. europaea]|uniref:ATP-dependent zinc metalloprotease FTSH 12, chloroplastic n=1 Tax=Olea europaea subsp. europaea TaxID=158383 RepID=A0A8S0SI04_OLEEU|nr:ATP-dependent zinc metalloprotease FTSH 12, chloroplastic [Olea europaea subsp. europaea]